MAGAVAAVAVLACAASVALIADRQRLLKASADVEQKLVAAQQARAAIAMGGAYGQSGESTGAPTPPPVTSVARTATTPNRALSSLPERQAVGATSLVALTLQPGAFRGESSGLRRVAVPDGAVVVRVMLDAPDATAAAYRADVMNSDGERILSLEKAVVTVRGSTKQVTLDVPVSVIPPGDYQIELHDAVAGTRLPRYSFRIRGR